MCSFSWVPKRNILAFDVGMTAVEDLVITSVIKIRTAMDTEGDSESLRKNNLLAFELRFLDQRCGSFSWKETGEREREKWDGVNLRFHQPKLIH